MQKWLITFSGAAYDDSTEQTVLRGPGLGADEVYVYDDVWLAQHEFSRLPANRWIFDHHGDEHGIKRGICWFAWKPLVMLDALSKIEDGGIVLYIDGDTGPIADFSVLYRECDRTGGIMLFTAAGCSNRQWVKYDCRAVMGFPCAPDTQHAVARFYLFQKGSWRTQQFLYEWLTYCLNPLATTFDPSILGPEIEGFQQHRTEQAILTLLSYKYGIRLYREACQFGEAMPDDRELYPQLFEQTYGAGPRDVAGSKFRRIP